MKTSETAERLYNYLLYEARDTDTTPEDIENDIQNNPSTIINFLLDIIEE